MGTVHRLPLKKRRGNPNWGKPKPRAARKLQPGMNGFTGFCPEGPMDYPYRSTLRGDFTEAEIVAMEAKYGMPIQRPTKLHVPEEGRT